MAWHERRFAVISVLIGRCGDEDDERGPVVCFVFAHLFVFNVGIHIVGVRTAESAPRTFKRRTFGVLRQDVAVKLGHVHVPVGAMGTPIDGSLDQVFPNA